MPRTTQTMDRIRWLKRKIAGYQFPYLYDETQEVALHCAVARRISTFNGDRETSTVVSLTTVVLAMVDPSPARTFEVQSRK